MRRKRREETDGSAPRKPGRKDGHQGVTQVFRPTDQVVHTMERCPRCGSTHLSVVSTERRTVVDVPEPLPYTVREHAVNTYRRPGCGADDLAPDSVGRGSPRPWRRRGTAASCSGRIRSPRCLRSGPWRGSSEEDILRSRVDVRPAPLPCDHRARPREGGRGARGVPGEGQEDRQQVEEGKLRRDGMPVGEKGSWMEEGRSREKVRVRRGRDEQGEGGARGPLPWFQGRRYGRWMEALRALQDDSEVLVAPAQGGRGAPLLPEGHLPRDGGRAGGASAARQEPPLRDAPEAQGAPLEGVHGCGRAEVRLEAQGGFDGPLHVHSLPGVEPTNSHAERQLREPTVHRKTRGQLKSENGMNVFGRLMTAVSTWKLQGLDPFLEFKRCL